MGGTLGFKFVSLIEIKSIRESKLKTSRAKCAFRARAHARTGCSAQAFSESRNILRVLTLSHRNNENRSFAASSSDFLSEIENSKARAHGNKRTQAGEKEPSGILFKTDDRQSIIRMTISIIDLPHAIWNKKSAFSSSSLRHLRPQGSHTQLLCS
jgi:hypothetical protein